MLSVLAGGLPPVSVLLVMVRGERKVDVTDSMGIPA